MKFFVHEFSTWTYCSFSSKRNLHWKYKFEKGKSKIFLSRRILSLTPYSLTSWNQTNVLAETEGLLAPYFSCFSQSKTHCAMFCCTRWKCETESLSLSSPPTVNFVCHFCLCAVSFLVLSDLLVFPQKFNIPFA